MNRHSIVLGGIGGDSHSVGINILRCALSAQGYHVIFLGTQNSLERFMEVAPMASIVMISNMDGHAHRYLRAFPELRKRLPVEGPLWYLGGNLTIDHGLGYERIFHEMGFHRVYVKFADIKTILETIEVDLAQLPTAGNFHGEDRCHLPASRNDLPIPDDNKVEDGDLFKDRREVLDHWRTGVEAADLRENAIFLAARSSSFDSRHREVDEKHLAPLVQPRCGVALVQPQIALFQKLKAGGADTLSYQVDSLTRNNDYIGAEEEIRSSRIDRRSTINGFPVVNHGVKSLRLIADSVNAPLQVRHSTRDPRLLAEISLAGGATAYEGGAICYNLPYYKDYPLEESIERWKYVDRLCGIYRERYGIVIDREFFGVLTATLIPPCIAITTCILEAILAAQQGVGSVSLGYAEQGNRSQDIAAIRMIRKLGRRYLDNFGYRAVSVHGVFHQYMAAFPQQADKAENLILKSAETAALSQATRVLTKTPVEALKVPSTEDNLQGLQLVHEGFNLARSTFVDEAAVEFESKYLEQEIEALMSAVLALGGGSISKGIVNAFKRGFLDIPFSPSIYCKGDLMTARDKAGAVRFVDFGSLPFDEEIQAFHRYCISERRRCDGTLKRSEDYVLVERDVLQIARGQYAEWPLQS